MATETPFELDTWTVPSDSRDYNWGEGIVVSRPGGPRVFFRFYEYNVFGAVREGGFSMADKQQPHTATCGDGEATVDYPDHGVTIDLQAVETGVELSLQVANDSDRDWPAVASLDPCLNPGRDRTGVPLVPDLVDGEERYTYYCGDDGLEPLDGQTLHVHEDHYDAVEEMVTGGLLPPTDDLPWTWCDRTETATESVLVRESPDGDVATGIAWEDAVGAQGHNPWHCMHLLARVGPLPAGETTHVGGKIYLEEGPKERVLDRYHSEFGG